MNPIEIARKIRDISKNHGLEMPSFSILIYYNQYKEAVYMEEGNSSTTEQVKQLCQKHLVDALDCPRCYPCSRVENINIYSAQWIGGTIVLASSTLGFVPQKILDESIKQLGIEIETENES